MLEHPGGGTVRRADPQSGVDDVEHAARNLGRHRALRGVRCEPVADPVHRFDVIPFACMLFRSSAGTLRIESFKSRSSSPAAAMTLAATL